MGLGRARRFCGHAEIFELGFPGSKRPVRRHLQEIRPGGKPAPDKPNGLIPDWTSSPL